MNRPSSTVNRHPSALRCWIEAMRLRTLPVSVAGVIFAAALALADGVFRPLPVIICLLFAVLAQIASNFANEYFDFRDGLDRPGRTGPRRGVTEGDITPRAMRNAAIGTLGVAALAGCTLIHWGGWWLIAAGTLIVAGALAYSAGPYPLSRHGWGEVAVIVFFGIAPVTLTYYLQAGTVTADVWLSSVSAGLLGANVLIVNNYRDREEDAAVGKRTLAVIFGPRFASTLYIVNDIAAVALMIPVWIRMRPVAELPVIFLIVCVILWRKLCAGSGRQLNPLLGQTAICMFAYAIMLLLSVITVM